MSLQKCLCCKFVLSLLLLPTLSQCVSVESLQNPEPNKIYAGTRAHLTLKCTHGVCIDAPFSFVVDTLLLPVTIPWSVVNYCQVPAVEPANSEDR